jgi:hypothetical protein
MIPTPTIMPIPDLRPISHLISNKSRNKEKKKKKKLTLILSGPTNLLEHHPPLMLSYWFPENSMRPVLESMRPVLELKAYMFKSL